MLNSLAVTLEPPALARRDAALLSARPQLEALARRLVWDAEDARDVVQATLVEALDHWHTLHDEAAAPAWLRRILVSRAYSHLRRRRFWNTVGAVLLVKEEEVAVGPDVPAEQRQHLQRLARELESLPAQQSLAFTLRYLEGWNLDEVADAMRIARGTVRIHVQRAVSALRERGVLE